MSRTVIFANYITFFAVFITLGILHTSQQFLADMAAACAEFARLKGQSTGDE